MPHPRRLFAALSIAFAVCTSAVHAEPQTPDDAAVPHYDHIFVIMDENKDFSRIDGGADAPHLTHDARAFGIAERFYGEVHPSEGNYVALIGGSTFGIHDDDAFFCSPGAFGPHCPHAALPGYAAHTVDAPNLAAQLDDAHLSWKGYDQSLPEPGSMAVTGFDAANDGPNAPQLYASKHSGFLNFASVQSDPRRAEHLVGFDQLDRDLAAGTEPNFALIIPNLCDDMHGMKPGPGVPTDCRFDHLAGLIRRGDRMADRLIGEIMRSADWRSGKNEAIVVTFDEDDGTGREGCCGVTPDAPSNFGGGHIATIVITNHGHGPVHDSTPYNHYSLLRTIEDAFGLSHIGLAASTSDGVRPMLPLFAQ